MIQLVQRHDYSRLEIVLEIDKHTRENNTHTPNNGYFTFQPVFGRKKKAKEVRKDKYSLAMCHVMPN